VINGDAARRSATGRIALRSYLPHIHPALRKVVNKATHRNPDKRYDSAAELRHALERARPAVSWRPALPAIGHAWEGVSADGTTGRAIIEPRPRKGHQFTLERRLAGRDWRRQTDDLYANPDQEIALSHAEQILGRVAQRGR
jgi:hypothetical protein